ncbi:MAG: DUF3179 domain-containing protein [Deltaproteobacteria bacterium]|nr:DUF3179 domain-containing protein [Deltaproteobacteria bacterium]
MSDVDLEKLNLFEDSGFWPAGVVFKTWKNPSTVAPADATWLDDDDEVLAVEAGGLFRAYPLAGIQSHHIVQDRMGDQEVLVTF